jgi:leucyl aminopeptidase
MLELTALDLGRNPIPALAVPVCEDRSIYTDSSLSALTRRLEAYPEFKGKSEQKLILHGLEDAGARRVIFLGLGEAGSVDAEALRNMAGRAVKTAMEAELTELAIAAPAADQLPPDEGEIFAALLEGAGLANHLSDDYKSERKKKPLERIRLFAESEPGADHADLPARAEALAAGTHLAREWVNRPANDKTPERYAAAIVEAAEAAGLKTSVMDEAELRERGFGALLAVARGSEAKPKLVILEYEPELNMTGGAPERTVALVGKGVTFDTGGYNLKISGSMSGMKADMGGSAAVAAALVAAARLRPKDRIIGLTPLVENMVSGNAIRPGDVFKSYLGKTVEIGNTDAEGRLILIDAMAYAAETYRPDLMIDFATLTGACLMGLGERIAGVFTKDDALAEAIVAAGKATGDRCWRLPLPDDYKEYLKSDLADISNMPSVRWGGAITAALFLSEFVGDTRWAHIDIAGPVQAKKGTAVSPPGATGFGVRLIFDLLNRLG